MIGNFIGAPIGAPLSGGLPAQALVQTAAWVNPSAVDYVHTLTLGAAPQVLVQTVTWVNSPFVDLHTLTAGPVNLVQLNVFQNPNDVDNEHALLVGDNNLAGIRYTNESVLDYEHVLVLGPAPPINLVQVNTFANPSSVNYAHVLTQGADLAQDGTWLNQQTWFDHVLTVGPANLVQVDVFTNPSMVDYAHTLGAITELVQEVAFENPNSTDYEHSLEQYLSIEPGTHPNQQTWHQHTLVVGEAMLVQQAVFVNQQRFRQHRIGSPIRLPAPRGVSAPYGDPGTTRRPSRVTSRPDAVSTRRP